MDLFWIAQMQQYASRYAQFVEILTTKVHMTTEDILPLSIVHPPIEPEVPFIAPS